MTFRNWLLYIIATTFIVVFAPQWAIWTWIATDLVISLAFQLFKKDQVKAEGWKMILAGFGFATLFLIGLKYLKDYIG